jgi:sugar phosphate isomerase/epimerase
MGIKRGVSLYSYQQEQFFKKMTLRDMLVEMRDVLGCRGVEIIDEAMVRQYPLPDANFYAEWNDLMQEFDMQPVTIDIYLDPLQFRDHVMTHVEAAERLKRDLGIASKMGFQNVRCLSAVPVDVIEMALPFAEELGIRIGKEIHAPNDIRSNTFDIYKGDISWKYWNRRNPRMCEEIINLADRKNSKFVGLVPDMGVFQITINRPTKEYLIRHGARRDVIDLVEKIIQTGIRNKAWAREIAVDTIPGLTEKDLEPCSMVSSFSSLLVKGQDLTKIVPYIVSVHGKCYELTEIEGMPGEYEDKAVDYATAIAALKAGNYEGYLNTEYEGQRSQQDRGMEFLADEREEVRRHQKMMSRLIGE